MKFTAGSLFAAGKQPQQVNEEEGDDGERLAIADMASVYPAATVRLPVRTRGRARRVSLT